MKTGFTETGFIVNRSVAGFIENRFRLPVSGSICGHSAIKKETGRVRGKGRDTEGNKESRCATLAEATGG